MNAAPVWPIGNAAQPRGPCGSYCDSYSARGSLRVSVRYFG